MTDDEYLPSDQDIEDTYASTWLDFQNELGRERFRAWLASHDARVRRDAAREALDGLAEHIDWTASQLLGIRVGSQKAQDVRDYRDTHYPEKST